MVQAQVIAGSRRGMGSVASVQRHAGAGVIPPSRAASSDEPRTSRKPSGLGRLCLVASVALFVWVGWKVAHGNYYTPRSDLGYYLGLIGTLMMLALLGYPLRKYVRCMNRWGDLKHWFRLHMFLGIVGPTLVVFHSTFQVRSLNAAVAVGSMLLVVVSGLIGRYLYVKIHFELYGRRATLQKLQEQFSGSSESAKSRLHFAQRVEHWLQRFESRSIETERRFPFSLLWFLTLGMRRKIVEFRCARELRRIMRKRRIPEFPNGAPQARHLVATYLKGVQRVGQFSMYERIFSLWHVLHIPLIYILAASTVAHVIAVYMY